MKPNHNNKFKWHELIDKKFVAVYIALALVLAISQVMFAIRPSKAAGPYYVSGEYGNNTLCDGKSMTHYDSSNLNPQSCPWQTVAKVNAPGFVYVGGDQILFRRGETFPGTLLTPVNGAVGNPIVYSDYDDPLNPQSNRPIIIKSGTYTYAVSIRDGRSNITLQNLQFQGGTNQNIYLYRGASNIVIDNVVSIGDFNGIIVQGFDYTNITISNITFSGMVAGKNGVYITGNNLTDIFIDNVKVNSCLNGIAVFPSGVGTNVSITNSDVSDCTNDAVAVSKTSTLNLSDLNLTDNGGRGVYMGGGINEANIYNVTATGNGKGIVISSAGATSNNIDISYSTFSSGTNGNGFGLQDIGTNSNVTVTNTTASNNLAGDGFNIHGNWTNVIFDHCVAENNGADGDGMDTDGDGFSFHDTSTGIIRYSESKNNKKSAIAHVNSSQVDMYYNLFYHETNGTIPLVTFTTGIGVYKLYNNVIYSGGATGTLLGIGNDATDITAYNNIFYGGSIGIAKEALVIIAEDYNIVNSVTNYTGMTAGIHSIEDADPGFVDASIYNFHLLPSSPAINAGIDVGLVSDYDNNVVPLGGAFDMGAFEFLLPLSPSTLSQYESDGITAIAPGVWTNQDTVVLKFLMSSGNTTDLLTPQVEIQENGVAFSDTVTNAGAPFAYVGVPVLGTVTVSGLVSGNSYHWQARIHNTAGDSSWVAMGDSPDFGSDSVAPTFTVNAGVEVDPVTSDVVRVTVTDAEGNLDTATVKYGFSADSTCNAGDTYGALFTSGIDFILATPHRDYLCVTAEDLFGNIGYQLIGQLNIIVLGGQAPHFGRPGDVTNLVVKADSTGKVILTWLDPTDEDLKEIVIRETIVNGRSETITYEKGKQLAVFTNRQVGSKYEYLVKARDTSGLESLGVSSEITIPAQGEVTGRGEEPLAEDTEITLPSGVAVGELIKVSDSTTVYFIDADKRRHTFPNEATFFSYFTSFDGIKTLPLSALSQIAIGRNVTVRPGTWLVKIQTDPKVYAVEPYGVLRWVSSETITAELYGSDWNTKIADVSPVFFVDYQVGLPITSALHPTGSAFSYLGDNKVYYIEDNKKRYIPSSVFFSNKFQNKFIIRNINPSITYPDGADWPSLRMDEIVTLR